MDDQARTLKRVLAFGGGKIAEVFSSYACLIICLECGVDKTAYSSSLDTGGDGDI